MPRSESYKGHEIVVSRGSAEAGRRAQAVDADDLPAAQPPPVSLSIDGEPIDFGKFSNGQFFLRENAYDWSDDLGQLARRLIDYRESTQDARRRERGVGD